jgi:peptidoglycan/LPS O-acetylase OafA/YrhL
MIAGEAQLRWEIQKFSFGILVLFIFLPLLSLLKMSIREADKKLRRRHLLILGLAVLIVLPYAFVGSLNFSWMAWGIWLYLGMLICVLFLELLNHLQGRRNRIAGFA